MKPESYVEAGSKGFSAKKMDVNQGNFEVAVKPDSAKLTSRKLTCSTVERWKTQDLARYEAGSWLTCDSKKNKRRHHYTALKCKVCSQFESVIKKQPKFSRASIDGSTNFRPTNLVDYAKSDIHKIAFSLYNKQQGQLPSAVSNSNQQNQPKLEFNLNLQQMKDLKIV